MTLTLEHQRQWCAEAGASLADSGTDHGVEWRIGPAPALKDSGVSYQPGANRVEIPAATHCAVCEAEFGTGQTLVRSSIVRHSVADQWTWRCVKCFDWTVATGLEGTRSSRRPTGPGYSREITPKQAAKQLVAAVQSSPRFRVELPESGKFSNRDCHKDLIAAVMVASSATAQPVATAPAKRAPKAKRPTYMEVFTPKTAPAPDADRIARNEELRNIAQARRAEVAEVAEAPTYMPETCERCRYSPPDMTDHRQHAELEAPAPMHRAFGIAAPAPVIEEIRPIAPALQRPTGPAPTSTLPTWAEEWLEQLVFDQKRDYARQYLAHILNGAPAPVAPSADWADKARKRADRLAKQAA